MGIIQVGTASWTDKSLIESGWFYPKGCTSAKDRLRFDASQFPIVEVDSSYHAMSSYPKTVADDRFWPILLKNSVGCGAPPKRSRETATTIRFDAILEPPKLPGRTVASNNFAIRVLEIVKWNFSTESAELGSSTFT